MVGTDSVKFVSRPTWLNFVLSRISTKAYFVKLRSRLTRPVSTKVDSTNFSCTWLNQILTEVTQFNFGQGRFSGFQLRLMRSNFFFRVRLKQTLIVVLSLKIWWGPTTPNFGWSSLNPIWLGPTRLNFNQTRLNRFWLGPTQPILVRLDSTEFQLNNLVEFNHGRLGWI